MKKTIFAAICAVLMLAACTSLSTSTTVKKDKAQKSFEKSIDKDKYWVPPNG